MCATAAKEQTDCVTDAEIAAAPLVASVDGFYWFTGYVDGCAAAHAASEHLFAVRGNRPMILATVPGAFGCQAINAVLRDRCRGACILVEPPAFTGLHPDEAYLKRLVNEFYPARR